MASADIQEALSWYSGVTDAEGLDEMARLVIAGARIDVEYYGRTFIGSVIAADNVRALERLKNCGADIIANDQQGFSRAANTAAVVGSTQALRFIIDEGGKPDWDLVRSQFSDITWRIHLLNHPAIQALISLDKLSASELPASRSRETAAL